MFKFLCWHDYKPIEMYYIIDQYYDKDIMYDINVFCYEKCPKCGKTRKIKTNNFEYLDSDSKNKMEQLLIRHGAIHYFEFMRKIIRGEL